MTKIPIIDQGKGGAASYFQFLFGNERRQILAYPTYEDVLNAVNDKQAHFQTTPLYKRKPDDKSDVVYFTNSLANLCTSHKIDEIRNEINRVGAKFTSKIHAKYHPDLEREGYADHQCPYTIQNENYYDMIKNGGNDFFLLLTTISKVAYNPQSLFAKNVHIALNEAYYKKEDDWKNDFITSSHDRKRPTGLNETTWRQPVNGYWQIFSDTFDFMWFKEIDEARIRIPSALEELLLNLLNLRLEQDEKIYIYSRDAFLSHTYLPKVEGFDYVNKPNFYESKPTYKYFPNFSVSNTRMERLSLPNKLLFFKVLHKIVKYAAHENEGKIALLLNDEMNAFFQILSQYRSERMQHLINFSVSNIDDKQRLDFIDAFNRGRKRKFDNGVHAMELIQTILTDYYVNYLKKEPWTRVETLSAKTAFYNTNFFPQAIILIGTNYQFYQAMQLITDGKELNYHSLKSGGITLKNKGQEKSLCGVYVRALKSLSNPYSVENVYVADPMFDYWNKTYPQIFDKLSVKSINLDMKSFELKDFI